MGAQVEFAVWEVCMMDGCLCSQPTMLRAEILLQNSRVSHLDQYITIPESLVVGLTQTISFLT